MYNNSGSGAFGQLVASVTFPGGITLTEGADDVDFFDLPSIQITDSAMGINGDLITWTKPTPIKMTWNAIAGSKDDDYLQILFEANRAGRGKFVVNDVITFSIIFPDGRTVTFTQGRITDGMPATSVASGARLKTKVYGFVFENRVVT
jgi:hypothetical protein